MGPAPSPTGSRYLQTHRKGCRNQHTNKMVPKRRSMLGHCNRGLVSTPNGYTEYDARRNRTATRPYHCGDVLIVCLFHFVCLFYYCLYCFAVCFIVLFVLLSTPKSTKNWSGLRSNQLMPQRSEVITLHAS